MIVERPCPEAGRLQVIVPNAVAAHGRICHALAGDPSQQLVTVGVTGSFGKTMTALMVRSIINAAGDRCGLVGSLGFCDGSKTRPWVLVSIRCLPNSTQRKRNDTHCGSYAIRTRARHVHAQAQSAWRACSPRWSNSVVEGESSKLTVMPWATDILRESRFMPR